MVTYGFELETIGANPRRLAEILANIGLNAQSERYNHETRNHWKAVSDGSLRSRFGGESGEVVSPILNLGSFNELKQVTRALSAAGVRVNHTCGVHVHVAGIDLSQDAVYQYARQWANVQNAIDLLVAPSRRLDNNVYARRLNDRDLNNIQNGNYVELDRYKTFNAQALAPRSYKAPTIEIRQHQGSLNAGKIWSWAEFITAFLTKVNSGFQFGTFQGIRLENTLELLDNLVLTDNTKRILTERATDFAGAL